MSIINREDLTHVQHIANSINEVESYLKGMDQEQFRKADSVQTAVSRNLMMIGEATQQISTDFKRIYGEVDYKAMENLRFAKFNVETERNSAPLWHIVKEDLPVIKEDLLEAKTKAEQDMEA